MGRILKKKGEAGAATSYLSRKQALKKLQLSLKDFRRLCILKGIYPVEPKHKKKVNKNSSANKTYYYLKDIQFLSHEPVIDKFREFRVFVKKLKKFIGRKDQDASSRLRNNPPRYRVDHIVKERYPTFIDAVRDIDDALSTCFLFSTIPKSRGIKMELLQLCRKLTVEFMRYVIESRSLRKVFISVKGFYYQAEIEGQLVTWVVPHALGYSNPTDVDFKIMVTFTEFYASMLGFVNFKLYNSINLMYPPKLSIDVENKLLAGEEDNSEFIAALNLSLKSVFEGNVDNEVQADEFSESADNESRKAMLEEEENIAKLKKLFERCKIFINREVPHESLVFVIRAFGGQVSFDKNLYTGATFEETDETITHHVVDRPVLLRRILSREYIQPQWVYDSINARLLLPIGSYSPGEILPPHLSPFVEEKEGDYVPPERQALLDMQKGLSTGIRRKEESSDEDDSDETEGIQRSTKMDKTTVQDLKKLSQKRKLVEEEEEEVESPLSKMKVVPGRIVKEDPSKEAERLAAEEKRLAVMMIPKKKKHLYDKIIFGQKRKKRESLKLQEKRQSYEREQKKLKKAKNSRMINS